MAAANDMALAAPAVSAEQQFLAGSGGLQADGPSDTEIAEAAYRRYLERGGTHGLDFDDWVSAERDLRERRHRT